MRGHCHCLTCNYNVFKKLRRGLAIGYIIYIVALMKNIENDKGV